MDEQRILGIDPGNEDSAWALWDGDEVLDFGKDTNWNLLEHMDDHLCRSSDVLAIEYMRPRGMPTSQAEMDTQFWAGRLVHHWLSSGHKEASWKPVGRLEVKMQMCGSARANDSNIRRAVLDRFPPTGKGSCPQKGTARHPGPLYGFAADMFSALAIAITAKETRE